MGNGASAGGGGAAGEGGILEVAPVANMLGKATTGGNFHPKVLTLFSSLPVKMFQMMDGVEWFNKTGWEDEIDVMGFGEPDFKEWFGLGINKYDNVIRISLPRNNCAGQLPFSDK